MDSHETNATYDAPDTIAILWHFDDVREVRPDLTDAQCCEVLWHCKECHDAEIGINWDVIRTVAADLFPQTGEATR